MLPTRNLLVFIAKHGLLFVSAYAAVKVLTMLLTGFPNLYISKPTMMRWHNHDVDLPLETELRVWPELSPLYGFTFGRVDEPGNTEDGYDFKGGTISFTSDELLQVLTRNQFALRARFSTIGAITVESVYGTEDMLCYCSPAGDLGHGGEQQYFMGLTLGPHFDSVEYIGTAKGFGRFYIALISALEQSDTVGVWRDVVQKCFSGMQNHQRDKARPNTDPAALRMFMDPKNWCPTFQARSGEAETNGQGTRRVL